jgi:hypothetical protein
MHWPEAVSTPLPMRQIQNEGEAKLRKTKGEKEQ